MIQTSPNYTTVLGMMWNVNRNPNPNIMQSWLPPRYNGLFNGSHATTPSNFV